MNDKLMKDIEVILENDSSKSISTATTVELYNALSKALMKEVKRDWKTDYSKKQAYYFSAEFLIGRSIYNNMLNLNVLSDVDEILKSRNLDIRCFEDIEDSALGNGGLGRLAACYLESAASVEVPLNGYGIRYRYGLFKQSFIDGYQCETSDDWTKCGDPWSIRREDDRVTVNIGGQQIYAVPYDMPVIGYGKKMINTLRLWQSEPTVEFDFLKFNDMDYAKALKERDEAQIISYVLYPNDSAEAGKKLRLKQEYFFSSASLQDIIRKYKKSHSDFSEFSKLNIIQLNDTHPVISIPELIRLLMLEGLSFQESYAVTKESFAFTNHTIMGEALEKWDVTLMKKLLPDVYAVIVLIQNEMVKELKEAKVSNFSAFNIIDGKKIHMARLAVFMGKTTNGVAAIHTQILKDNLFKEWYNLYPAKFQNKTNGITPRRWLELSNPKLSELITSKIGKSWIKELDKLKGLESYISDDSFIEKFKNIRQENKKELADFIEKHERIKLDTNFIFDIQIKRLHEYKRQLLNAFSILDTYFKAKEKRIPNYKPTAYIFGAKAAPGYYNAKAIIKFINSIAELVNSDPEMNDVMKVVYVQNYNVSYAEKLVSAADISEQISMAGMEASGTGNMKFMLNGTVTLGTLDGANVEIVEEAGKENNYIFGLTVEEVSEVKKHYMPKKVYENNADLKRVVDTLIDGTFVDKTGLLQHLYDSLFSGHEPDNYLVLYEFDAYINEKQRVITEYGGKEFFIKSIKNLANAGKFSSDRAIKEYARDIWKV